MYTYIYIYTYMHPCVYKHIIVCVYIYIYICIHTYIHTHTYMYTHTCMCMLTYVMFTLFAVDYITWCIYVGLRHGGTGHLGHPGLEVPGSLRPAADEHGAEHELVLWVLWAWLLWLLLLLLLVVVVVVVEVVVIVIIVWTCCYCAYIYRTCVSERRRARWRRAATSSPPRSSPSPQGWRITRPARKLVLFWEIGGIVLK